MIRRALTRLWRRREPEPEPFVCDWQPDDLNPGPECPYCAGAMCARLDGLDCRHNREERHGYPAVATAARDHDQPDFDPRPDDVLAGRS